MGGYLLLIDSVNKLIGGRGWGKVAGGGKVKAPALQCFSTPSLPWEVPNTTPTANLRQGFAGLNLPGTQPPSRPTMQRRLKTPVFLSTFASERLKT